MIESFVRTVGSSGTMPASAPTGMETEPSAPDFFVGVDMQALHRSLPVTGDHLVALEAVPRRRRPT